MIFAQPKFNQFCLSVYCVVGLFMGMPATVCAHVYEDGFVERSLTITIRDGVGYGEYQIGLNAKTADEILELAELQKQKNVRPELLQGQPTVDNHHDRLKTPQPISPTKALDTSESTKLNQVAEPKTKANPKQSRSPQESGTVGAGEHLTDLATIKRFGGLQQQWFAGQLKLSNDGEPVELSKLSVEPAARHPYSVLVKFQFSLDQKKKKASDTKPLIEEQSVELNPDPPNGVVPANRVVDFQVADRLFEGYQGAVRYALRTRGSTMLLRSNVAPVLVRAERVEIDQKTSTSKEGSPTIQAKLAVGSQ